MNILMNVLAKVIGATAIVTAVVMVFVILIGWVFYYGPEFMIPCYWIFGVSFLVAILAVWRVK